MIFNSNLSASGDETLRDNKSRDLQEKIFNVWKNERDNNRIRVSSDPCARGKIFWAFLSVLLHKALENQMNQTGLLNKYTVSLLLDECKKFYRLKLKNGYKKNSEIPLRTRVIFELLCPGTIVKYGGKLGDISAAIKRLQAKCGKLPK